MATPQRNAPQQRPQAQAATPQAHSQASALSASAAALPAAGSGSGLGSASARLSAHAGAPRGVGGLVNLGNTCYMNAALQCLSNVPQLSEFFAGSAWRADRNARSATRGEVADAFADLMARMWGPGGGGSGGAAERPDRLKRAIALASPRFAGYEQHDSQELLRALLDALHDDTNRVRAKLAYEELHDPPGDADAKVSEAWWRYFAARSDSRVWGLFAGQLRTETQCQACRHRSRAFDPFLDLSLPIRDARDCSLAQCLTHFTSPERIGGGDWYCPRCRKHQPAEKRISLFRLPPVLVLHLKRFSSGAAGSPGFGSYGGGLRTKIAAASLRTRHRGQVPATGMPPCGA